MKRISRRHFILQSAAAGAVATGPLSFASETSRSKRSVTDVVSLGKSGVKVTRLGIGTGTRGGADQRELGQKKFTALVRHAYDQGIRFFDTADSYGEMHEMVAEALKGIDRDTYSIQTKFRMSAEDSDSPLKAIDRFRKELKSDYFDSLLLHCMQGPGWREKLKRQMDELDEAKEKQLIRSHGASCHGLPALEAMPDCRWLDVAFVRINHDGTHMDGPTGKWAEPGIRETVVSEVEKIHKNGTGVLAMKLFGNGDFKNEERREKSIRFVTQLKCVDAYICGFKSPAEIDEAVRFMNTHLNA